MSKADQDNKVGYGKPPRENQYKPGESGNLNGRPKGSSNFASYLRKRLLARGPDGKSVLDAAFLALEQQFRDGDQKSLTTLIGLASKHDIGPDAE